MLKRLFKRRRSAGLDRACENLLGSWSPDPKIAAYYRERARRTLLAAPDLSESARAQLLSDGAACSDEEYAATERFIEASRASRA